MKYLLTEYNAATGQGRSPFGERGLKYLDDFDKYVQ